MSDATLAVQEAIFDGDIEKLRAAVKAGGDLDYVSKGVNWNHLTGMLVSSAKHLTVEMIQFLIDAGNDVNLVDQFGNTSVMYAVRAKRADILEVLLKAGGLVNYFNIDEQSPLVLAVETIDTEYLCAKVLLKHGADPELESETGITAKKVVEQFMSLQVANQALRQVYEEFFV
ncbi:ankyrin repeat domain-containing protein [Maricaulis sp.]|uniref:ankyrin repeat domain-containing protein n=1 Tax=Maricaulis sp. TaxID=1486257 RepID=UPI001B023D5A|nr:ankyrin repeat domain-containing protein [Maricaulis sp.]MBO6796605.1 ankyrin repeat domain-containing protein [Maricaulis sp.]